MTKISVIIPCYRPREDLLTAAADSVLAQDQEDMEILLVDNGNDASAKALIRSVAETDPRFHVIESARGVSAARNAGLDAARGAYICFLDCDDEFLPGWLSQALACFEEDPELDLAAGGIHVGMDIQAAETPRYTLTDKETYRKMLMGRRVTYAKNSYFGRGVGARLFRETAVRGVRFDESLTIGEDYLWNLDVLVKCRHICVCAASWYRYKINAGSLTHNPDGRLPEKLEAFLMKVRPRYDLNDPEEYRKYIETVFEGMNMVCHNCLYDRPQEGTYTPAEIRQRLYKAPWNEVQAKGAFKAAGRIEKVKILLYDLHLLIPFWRIKTYLRKEV